MIIKNKPGEKRWFSKFSWSVWKLIELRNRSQRNNFQIDNINEESNKTWEAFEQKYI